MIWESYSIFRVKATGKVIRHLNVLEDVSIVAVVGSGMRGIKGIAGKIFTSIAKENVNVIMIVQGSSELNLAFVVRDIDCENAWYNLYIKNLVWKESNMKIKNFLILFVYLYI